MTSDADRTRAYRARKYAAGYHYVHGKLTREPRKGPRPAPPHGTAQRYYSRRYRCRCDECRPPAMARQREYRARRRLRLAGYVNTGGDTLTGPLLLIALASDD